MAVSPPSVSSLLYFWPNKRRGEGIKYLGGGGGEGGAPWQFPLKCTTFAFHHIYGLDCLSSSPPRFLPPSSLSVGRDSRPNQQIQFAAVVGLMDGISGWHEIINIIIFFGLFAWLTIFVLLLIVCASIKI
jgi:hypothetical protein